MMASLVQVRAVWRRCRRWGRRRRGRVAVLGALQVSAVLVRVSLCRFACGPLPVCAALHPRVGQCAVSRPLLLCGSSPSLLQLMRRSLV